MRTESLGIAAFELFSLSKHITTIGLEGVHGCPAVTGFGRQGRWQMQGLISVHMYPFQTIMDY
jgi:hypothetical protein